MNAPLMSRLKELQDENRRLKKLYVEAWLNADLLKGAMAKIVRPPQRREMVRWVVTRE